jgi:hypothetical protein
MYDHAVPIARPLIPELYSSELFTTTIWGPTCDSMDRITTTAKLPSMPLGHWIAFEVGFLIFLVPSCTLLHPSLILYWIMSFRAFDIQNCLNHACRIPERTL